MLATTFWQTGIGGLSQHILPAIGIVLVIGAILWSIGDLFRGKVGHAATRVVVALVVAAVISSPSMIGGLMSGGKTVVKDTGASASQIAHTTTGVTPTTALRTPTTSSSGTGATTTPTTALRTPTAPGA